MRIGMILDHEFPFDDRVEKEALSLLQAGYKVFLLSPNYGSKSIREDYKSIQIFRFKMAEKIRKKFNPTYLLLPLYRWIWYKQIERFILNNQINILHIHDLPLSDIGVQMKVKHGIKLVCDQHEYWSNWIGYTAHYNTKLGKIVKFLSNWKKFEKENLLKADFVVTVEEPLRQAYIENVRLDPAKVVCVPNTPLKSIFNLENVDQSVVEKYKDCFTLFYAGVVDVTRGLSTVVEALPEIVKSIPYIKFLIAGRIARNCNLFDLAKKLNVDKHIEFLGMLPIKKLPSYIAASDACINIPPAINEEKNRTIATKVYQYLLMEKPIIVGQTKLLKKFVLDNQIGISIKELDSKDFAQQVIDFRKSKSDLSLYIEQSRKIKENYSWEKTIEGLIRTYKNLE